MLGIFNLMIVVGCFGAALLNLAEKDYIKAAFALCIGIANTLAFYFMNGK